MLLANKVALITGSGRGIGRAMALLFAKEGAAVFLTARTEKELAETAAAITKNGGRVAYAPADLAMESACQWIVKLAQDKLGGIDILVNNGGHYGPVVPVEEYPLAEFDKVIAVHLRAAFLLTKLVLPGMYARQYGVILNISSLSAKAAYAWGSAYAAAKAGLGAVLAKRLGVNEEQQLAGFLSGLLQGRGPTAAEIARAALFLCSEESSAMTGQSINVDGGVAFY